MNKQTWTDKQTGSLIRLYPTTPAAEIASQLNKSVAAVNTKARKLFLKKEVRKKMVRNVEGDWTDEQVKILRKLYPKKNNEEVAVAVGKSVPAIRAKAVKLRLKKSDRYWDKPEEDYVLAQWPVLSAVEIGEKLKKTKWSVINKYRELTGKR